MISSASQLDLIVLLQSVLYYNNCSSSILCDNYLIINNYWASSTQFPQLSLANVSFFWYLQYAGISIKMLPSQLHLQLAQKLQARNPILLSVAWAQQIFRTIIQACMIFNSCILHICKAITTWKMLSSFSSSLRCRFYLSSLTFFSNFIKL